MYPLAPATVASLAATTFHSPRLTSCNWPLCVDRIRSLANRAGIAVSKTNACSTGIRCNDPENTSSKVVPSSESRTSKSRTQLSGERDVRGWRSTPATGTGSSPARSTVSVTGCSPVETYQPLLVGVMPSLRSPSSRPPSPSPRNTRAPNAEDAAFRLPSNSRGNGPTFAGLTGSASHFATIGADPLATRPDASRAPRLILTGRFAPASRAT